MSHNNAYVNLELSGSPMTGFRHAVPRAWVLRVDQQELIRTFQETLLEFCRHNNMWQLEQTVNRFNLHIHDNNERGGTIYICTDPH